MKRSIFISYSRFDFNLVKTLKEQIEEQTNSKCWMDLEGIESGNPEFTKVIVNGINECKVFLFMLSCHSQKSPFALGELNLAYKKANEGKCKKNVVMVNIDNCQMNDDFYLLYSRADIIDWGNAAQHDKLIRDIIKWTGACNKDKTKVKTMRLPQVNNNNPTSNIEIVQTKNDKDEHDFTKDKYNKINEKGSIIVSTFWLVISFIFCVFISMVIIGVLDELGVKILSLHKFLGILIFLSLYVIVYYFLWCPLRKCLR